MPTSLAAKKSTVACFGDLPAGVAGAAGGVDLADHAPPHPLPGALRLLHHAHELVAGDAAERVVAAPQLEVGVADTGEAHPHQRFAGCRSRHLFVFQAYGYSVVATSPGGGALTYALANRPTGMAITPAGVISWTRPTTRSGTRT